MKRVLSLICALLLCLPLVSCSLISFDTEPDGTGEGADTKKEQNTQDTSGTGTNSADTSVTGRFDSAWAESYAALDAVATADLGGLSYIITCSSSEAVFGDFEGETLLSRTKYERIMTLSERLNADIIVDEATTSDIVDGLNKNKDSGMVYSHLIAVRSDIVGTLNYQGLVGNINALPFVDLSKPYYDADFCEELRTPSGLYAIYGDACRDEDSYTVMFYNDAYATELGYDGLEGAVKDGKWTLDLLGECVKAASAAKESGGGYVAAVSPDSTDMFRAFYVSSGMDSVLLEGGKLVLHDNRDLGDAVVSGVKKLLSSYYGGAVEEKSSEQIFFDGGALFYVGTLGAVRDIYNMPDVWGLLPMPAVEEGGGYRTPMSAATHVICYPASNVNANETGIMIESLFACSYKILDAMFFDGFLHGYVRNEKTLDMLGYVLSDVRTDFALFYGEEFANFGTGTVRAFVSSCYDDTAYSRRFAQNRTAATRSLTFVK